MKDIVVFSENNKFILELFKDKNFKKQFSIKCIIASVINLKNLKDSFKNEKIVTIENFTKSNLKFIPKNKKNLMDENNYKHQYFQAKPRLIDRGTIHRVSK